MKPLVDPRALVWVLAACLMPWMVTGLAAAPPTSAADQLQRMADAVNSLSFEGTLVYLHKNRLETLHIRHSIEDGQVRERLISMTGPVRAVTREDDEVTCVLPNSQTISVRRHGVTHDLLRSRALDPELLGNHYEVRGLGVARVAGRETEVVELVPSDDLRYGYRFYLDRETGLPLKTDLMGAEAEPIEQIMFTSLQFTHEDASGNPVTSLSIGPRHKPWSAIAAETHWRFAQMPDGFELLMHKTAKQAADGSAEPEHFLLSDGLAAVSVYIEPDSGGGLVGETRIGAIHAAGGRIAGYHVTVVGEVPAATVAMFLASLEYIGEDLR